MLARKIMILCISALLLISSAILISGEKDDHPMTGDGTRASIGQKFYFNKTFNIDQSWNTDDIYVVVFVQSNTQVNKNMQNDPGRSYDSAEVLQSTTDFFTGVPAATGAQKRVLGECFTATWCGYCPGSVGAHDRIASDPAFFPGSYSLIEWHATSSDHNLGNADSNARFQYYNWGGAIPFSTFDGVIGHIGGSANGNETSIDTTYKGYINQRKGISSPVSLETFGHKGANSGWINVSLEVLDIPDEDLYKVQFVVVEDLRVDKNLNPWNPNSPQAIYRYTARDVLTPETVNLGNSQPDVSIDYPAGGEVITGNLHINWTATDPEDDDITISIDYRKGNGIWANIDSDLTNTGTYVWDTTTVVDGDDYRVRVVGTDAVGKQREALLGSTFTIKNDFGPTVQLTSPLGGEVWNGTQTITWMAEDDGGDGNDDMDAEASADITIRLDFTRNDGADYSPIYSGLANTGSYEWDTNTTLSWNADTYKVKIMATDTKGQTAWAISTDTFEINNEKNFRDEDNDNMPDEWEELYDDVEVGENDAMDDADSDGLRNIEEYHFGTDPSDDDTDGDGMTDGWEINNELNVLEADSNLDSDGDGLINLQEFQIGTYANRWDSENDGIPDGWEVNNGLIPMGFDSGNDDDEDDLDNLEEYLNGTDPNNDDSDEDKILDGWEVKYGFDPLDDDDASEDFDGDGLTNLQEFQINTKPTDGDTDMDIMTDGWEIQYDLDPLMGNDAGSDPDGDLMTNVQEFENGTNPLIADTDGDQIKDGWELDNGLDPLLNTDAALDNDNDDLSNLDEFKKDLDPNNNDTDSDGMPDGWELDYDLDPKNPSDGDDDPDEDELTNLQEYFKGLNPNEIDNPDYVPKDDDDDKPLPKPKDNKDTNDDSGSSSTLWIIVIIVVIFIIAVIGVLVAIMVKKGKKGDLEGEDEMGRVDEDGHIITADEEYQKLYGPAPASPEPEISEEPLYEDNIYTQNEPATQPYEEEVHTEEVQQQAPVKESPAPVRQPLPKPVKKSPPPPPAKKGVKKMPKPLPKPPVRK